MADSFDLHALEGLDAGAQSAVRSIRPRPLQQGRLRRHLPVPHPPADRWPVAHAAHPGIAVAALDRDAPVPLPAELVVTNGWLRPRLWGGRPVLPVERRHGLRREPWLAVASLKRNAETALESTTSSD